MQTLMQAYQAPNVTQSHKDFVWGEVAILTKGKKGSRQEIFDLLRLVYRHYDNGGHSSGRSRRSQILERCLSILQKSRMTSNDRCELCEKITTLVSMYHDDEYIRKMCWYDYPDDNFALISSVSERVPLLAVFTLLGLTNLTQDHRLQES